ncbi:MAG: hypothetical protein HQ495_14885 [Alphaproteobacteria bacterium]|nr:hypothetical protein [Alphaproteobacteria bacterium]
MSRAVLIGLAVLVGTFAVSAFVARPVLPTDPAPETAALPSVDALVTHFDQLIFGNPRRNRLVRWGRGAIRLVFNVESAPPDGLDAGIDLVVRDMSSATGLWVYADRNKRNLPIGTIRIEVAESAQQTVCSTQHHVSFASGRPTYGLLRLEGRHTVAALPSCVRWGSMIAFGASGRSCHARPSTLCPADHDDRLHPVDKAFLKVFFDPRLEHGMRRSAALAIARDIFAEQSVAD